MVPVKRGISDDSYSEITDGVKEGDEVISGSYKAVSRELEDEKKVRKGASEGPKDKDKEKK
jgi:HlyD family secretion protein